MEKSLLTFPQATWRLLITPPALGAWNMAVDEAILEAVGRGESTPTLRLYTWEPACLSLGYAQPYADVDLPALQAHGWVLVRRPTGGRAILHTDELTYSVIGPPDEPRLAGSVLESYRVLSQALLHALHLIGVPAEALPKHAGQPASGLNPVCFEVPSNYEITVQGKKLIGSAQARRKEGVLQHGSLPLFGDLTRITQALKFERDAQRQEAARRLLEHATTVEAVLGRVPTLPEARQAFSTSFESTLNLSLQPGELSEAEAARAEALVTEKYGHPGWTEKPGRPAGN